ncbi:MAG: hypothetical protein WDN31_03260 [Hyphomicrobium sp.]
MLAAKLPLSAAIAAIAALTALAGVAIAETAAEVPKDSYYHDPLTPSEQSGISQEENVTPSDGRASVPNPQDDGIIPDAAIDQGNGASPGPSPLPETADKKVRDADEADVVIEDSKKDYKVTKKDMASCMKDWGPQTQMTKEEWAASCRTTLEYFPGGQ